MPTFRSLFAALTAGSLALLVVGVGIAPVAGRAHAQGAAEKPAEKKAAAPASPPAPNAGPPKPGPEIDHLKFFEGNWRCDGKVPAGPMGPEHGFKSTFKVKRDLDGFWYVAEYEQKKSKENPVPIRARAYFGYDGGTKKYVLSVFDNVGGIVLETSPGWEGERMIASGEGTAMGQRVGFRETFTKKAEKEMAWLGEMKMGKDWMVVGSDTCRR